MTYIVSSLANQMALLRAKEKAGLYSYERFELVGYL